MLQTPFESALNRVPSTPRSFSPDIQDKIKRSYDPLLGILHGYQQLREEKRVALVACFSRKIELCGEHRLVWGLDFDVDVGRTAWIKAGKDCLQIVTAVFTGELMAAQLIASVIILAVAVCLPEVQPRTGNWRAIRGKHISRQDESGPHHARLDY